MIEYDKCRMDTFYFNGLEPWVNHPCKVVIDGNRIKLDFQYEDGEHVTYTGEETVSGGYHMKGFEYGGNVIAELRYCISDKHLYGEWKNDNPESSYSGIWIVTLR